VCIVGDHQAVIGELVGFNRRLHLTVEDLNQRLARIESGRPAPLQGAFTFANKDRRDERAPAVRQTLRFRSEVDERSRSPSSDHEDYRQRNDERGGRGMTGKRMQSAKKGGRGLQIKIPGKIRTGLPIVGLPTPMSADMVCSTLQVMRILYAIHCSIIWANPRIAYADHSKDSEDAADTRSSWSAVRNEEGFHLHHEAHFPQRLRYGATGLRPDARHAADRR
jgi:hypothetical protein